MSQDFVHQLYAQTKSNSHRIFGPDYYGDFLNWGYWKADTESQIEACENLVELVVSLIPRREGTLLDVGCGVGGVIRHLTRYWPPSRMTGINIMEDQLQLCQERVPQARFVRMDATDLDFPDGTFDTVICVEAAFHFNTRRRFLQEALRVLVPGGYLALADIIGIPYGNHSNFVSDSNAFRDLLRDLGYCEIRAIDVTNESAHSHADHGLFYLDRRHQAGDIANAEFERAALSRVIRLTAGRCYIVAGARKPIPGKPRWKSASGGVDAYIERLLVDTASL